LIAGAIILSICVDDALCCAIIFRPSLLSGRMMLISRDHLSAITPFWPDDA
jgi:hypothetical protein